MHCQSSLLFTTSWWHHWLDGREFEWTPGVGDGQGGPGMLRFMGSQRVGHDWATDLIWSDVEVYLCCLWLMWNSSAGEGNKSQKTLSEQMSLTRSMSSALSPVPQSPDWALRTRGLGKSQHPRLESKLVKTFFRGFPLHNDLPIGIHKIQKWLYR